MAIAVSFYFDDSVRHFIMQHENRAMRNFMHYVSLFGDWPAHILVGLFLLGFAWAPRKQTMDANFFWRCVIAMSLAGVAGTVIKRTVHGPSVSAHRHTLGRAAFQFEYHSFPSGHVALRPRFLASYLSRVGASALRASQSRF